MIVREEVRYAVNESKSLKEEIQEALGDAMLCGRVWWAWECGTMTEDDFMQAADSEEFVAEMVAVIEARIRRARIRALEEAAEIALGYQDPRNGAGDYSVQQIAYEIEQTILRELRA